MALRRASPSEAVPVNGPLTGLPCNAPRPAGQSSTENPNTLVIHPTTSVPAGHQLLFAHHAMTLDAQKKQAIVYEPWLAVLITIAAVALCFAVGFAFAKFLEP